MQDKEAEFISNPFLGASNFSTSHIYRFDPSRFRLSTLIEEHPVHLRDFIVKSAVQKGSMRHEKLSWRCSANTIDRAWTFSSRPVWGVDPLRIRSSNGKEQSRKSNHGDIKKGWQIPLLILSLILLTVIILPGNNHPFIMLYDYPLVFEIHNPNQTQRAVRTSPTSTPLISMNTETLLRIIHRPRFRLSLGEQHVQNTGLEKLLNMYF
jgi:hypothetical protein